MIPDSLLLSSGSSTETPLDLTLCVDQGVIINKQHANNRGNTPSLVLKEYAQHQEEDEISPIVTSYWDNLTRMPVLIIRCKGKTAEFYKNRFGSGSRGQCILYAGEWYTPLEFECLCGQDPSRDWKTTIRCGGKPINDLMVRGILQQHDVSCTCKICGDDDNGNESVSYFTPYKRRRLSIYCEEEEEENCNKKDAFLPGMIADYKRKSVVRRQHGGNSFVEHSDDLGVSSVPVVKNCLLTMDAASDSVSGISTDFIKVLSELKDIQRARQLSATEQQPPEDDVPATQAHMAPVPIEDLGLYRPIHPPVVSLYVVSRTLTQKCVNCNRDTENVCRVCQQIPFCTDFCHQKRWPCHEAECRQIRANYVSMFSDQLDEVSHD